ncbi:MULTISPECIES: DUF2846 domain-containing protein [unclassified Uliginosibacterium]|uniref:DUF2846 domain-containing protein n=1 Tax=unclassified Uliginosibacterium TaxID=2621521 RepID=UPI000C7DAD3C|nr:MULTISPECIES: DUF2846 domain-containing protein [unclassified Uliginosibacterium]MDO6387585.1 DUF2846 domain-containing protein [Uliginosibacterium sp. 31-12]PLK47907.1 hypothetical protein C0V76_14125 [Uliginosibacterium sp. TH139]
MIRRILTCSFLAAAALMTGCASVPMATPEQDAAAKSFAVTADKANVYIYRNENLGGAVKMPVVLDGKIVGDTLAKTYIKQEVAAGSHTIVSKAENDAELKFDVVAGKNYFVWQEVKMGIWMARSALNLVDEAQGKAGVAECKLIEGAK